MAAQHLTRSRFHGCSTLLSLSLSLCSITGLCSACEQHDAKPVTQIAQQTPATKPQETKPQQKPAEAKPTDTKPADTKPTEAKPANPKPADQSQDPKNDPAKQAQADPWPPPANKPLPTMDVKLGDKKFKLEMAMDGKTRFGGLSGRKEVAEDGGMIFVFRSPQELSFVMRDCPVGIDIIYVDATGRIVAMHHMAAEPPRSDAEKIQPGQAVNAQYESRLKKYSSGYAACVVIELKLNTLDIDGDNPGGIKLKKTDKLEIDVTKLRQQAQP